MIHAITIRNIHVETTNMNQYARGLGSFVKEGEKMIAEPRGEKALPWQLVATDGEYPISGSYRQQSGVAK